MKKSLLYLLLLGMSSTSVYCQELTDGNKFFDNWSIGVKGGTVAPLMGKDFSRHMRPEVGRRFAAAQRGTYCHLSEQTF